MLRDPFFWILMGICTAVVGLWWAFAHPQPLRLRSRGGLGTLGARRRSHR